MRLRKIHTDETNSRISPRRNGLLRFIDLLRYRGKHRLKHQTVEMSLVGQVSAMSHNLYNIWVINCDFTQWPTFVGV